MYGAACGDESTVRDRTRRPPHARRPARDDALALERLRRSSRRTCAIESERRFVSLRVSTRGLRTIEKKGIETVVAELRAKGVAV